MVTLTPLDEEQTVTPDERGFASFIPPGAFPPFNMISPGTAAMSSPQLRKLVSSLFGPLPDEDLHGYATQTLPTAAATGASMLAGPAGVAARGLPLAARLARVAPSIGAAGAGGAAGGAVGNVLEGGEDIAGAALGSGAEMAGAEALGLGVAGTARRLAAPAAGLLDDAGRNALKFARENFVPGERGVITGAQFRPPISPEQVAPGTAQEMIQGAADFLIPSRFITQGRRRMVTDRVLALPMNQRNEVIKKLVSTDTQADTLYGLVKPTAVADKVARAIGQKNALTLGYDRGSARDFIRRAFESGDPEIVGKLAKESDALTLNLEALLTGATRNVNGKRVLDGEKLLSDWEALPDAAKKLYAPKTRDAVENFAAYAAASQRVPELAEQAVLTFGPGVVSSGIFGGPLAAGLGADPVTGGALMAGISALTARSLMNPSGLFNRWLTSEALPPEMVNVLGRETVKLMSRKAIAGNGEDDE